MDPKISINRPITSPHLYFNNTKMNTKTVINLLLLVRAACVRCHGTKCPLLTAFFLFLSLRVTFLPEGVIVGFWNFEYDFKSQKNKIWGGKQIGGLPPGGLIFRFFLKKRKLLRVLEYNPMNLNITQLNLKITPFNQNITPMNLNITIYI